MMRFARFFLASAALLMGSVFTLRADDATKSAVAEFLASYNEFTAQIKAQPTAVKQDEIEHALPKKLDDKLRSQTWELRCPISEVKDAGKSRFKILHGPPDELGDEKHWDTRASTILFLSREDALALKPGDYLIYSGRPRFTTANEFPECEFLSQILIQGSAAKKYFVSLTAMKIRIQRAGESKPGNEIKSP